MYNYEGLINWINEQGKIGVAVSGGIDSAYLLYVVSKTDCDVTAYYVKSQFQPEFELRDAKEIVDSLGVKFKVIYSDVFDDPDIVSNTSQRCYYCKKRIFGLIVDEARKGGIKCLVDGTNASDDVSDRPGYKALNEMNVYSPLRMFEYTKEDIRREARKAGINIWNKPSFACLATRIPVGKPIIPEDLIKTERNEGKLFDLGFKDFRLRIVEGGVLMQVCSDEMEHMISSKDELTKILKPDYGEVLFDDNPRKIE